jgi:hypothetical protein
MKYLFRRRVRSRAGGKSSTLSSIRGAGPVPAAVTTPGSLCRVPAPGGIQQRGDDDLAFPPHDRVHRAFPPHDRVHRAFRLGEHVRGDERHRMPAGEHEAAGHDRLDQPGQLDDFRHIRQVVEAEADRFRPEITQLAYQVVMAEHLQVQQAHVVPSRPGGGGHALQAERFQPQEDLRVHQAARVDEQGAHEVPSDQVPKSRVAIHNLYLSERALNVTRQSGCPAGQSARSAIGA